MRLVDVSGDRNGSLLVNPQKVAFVSSKKGNPGELDRVRIFFSGGGDDYIAVTLPLREVREILEGGVRAIAASGNTTPGTASVNAEALAIALELGTEKGGDLIRGWLTDSSIGIDATSAAVGMIFAAFHIGQQRGADTRATPREDKQQEQ